MTRLDHHDPNAQDMKPWKRCCFHKFTMSFAYGKDALEMLTGTDIMECLSIWMGFIAFHYKEPTTHLEKEEKARRKDSEYRS
ncbi:hypothetical protein Tco_0076077 [Tanacetum coccineum]